MFLLPYTGLCVPVWPATNSPPLQPLRSVSLAQSLYLCLYGYSHSEQMQLRCPAGARACRAAGPRGPIMAAWIIQGTHRAGKGAESSRCRRHAPSLFMLNFIPDPDGPWKDQTDVARKKRGSVWTTETGCWRDYENRILRWLNYY